jgi:four helix bundle protein
MKYSDLHVWQKSMDLVVEIYRFSKEFPAEERFALTNQIQRAAVSVPSDIAEGHGRKSTKSFLYLLSLANGSLMEVETQIQIAQRLGYVREDTVTALLARTGEIGRMLNGLQSSLESKLPPESRILDPES